jgi:hypothetical protein
MNRQKIIAGVVLIIVFVGAAIIFLGNFQKIKSSPISLNDRNSSPVSVSTRVPITGNAFLSAVSDGISLPDANQDVQMPVSSSDSLPLSPSKLQADAGLPLTGNEGNNAVLSSNADISSTTNQSASLSLPDVSDSELTIGADGATSPLDYVIAFNADYKKVDFDYSRFNTVLKDDNGVPLFIPSLIEKAIADNNFSEIRDSLEVQKDFANADIALMKSIRVADGAVSFDKEVIGTEELTVQLADDALDVSSGGLSRGDFDKFNDSFSLTVGLLHDDFAHDMEVALSAGSPRTKSFLGSFADIISPVALADTPGVSSHFGGKITAIVPAIFAVFVTISPPVPAEITVPDAFLATPLFFSMKSMVPGSWCIGLYETAPPETVIMMGTSLPVP